MKEITILNFHLSWKRLVFSFLGLLFISTVILTFVSPKPLLGPAAGWAGIKIAMASIAIVLIVVDVVLLIGILRLAAVLVIMIMTLCLIILFPLGILVYFLVKWIFKTSLFDVLERVLGGADPSSGEPGADVSVAVAGILAIIVSVAGWFAVIALWHF